MKNYRVAIVYLFALIALQCCSCTDQKPKEVKQPVVPETKPAPEYFEAGQLIPSLRSKNDASLSFALYVPKNYSHSVLQPAIIFFDPHGKGNYPLSIYQHLADQFGIVLVGSNDSKNGMTGTTTTHIADVLEREVAERLAVDATNITLAGFSGGAKVALTAGAANPSGQQVIYSGAATPVQSPHNISLLGFAGKADMNFTDLVSFDESLTPSGIHHLLIEWNGKHEWPDTVTFRDAFYWISFRDKERNSTKRNSALVQEFKNHVGNEIRKTNDPLTQTRLLEKAIFVLSGIDNIAFYQESLDSVRATPSFIKAMNDFRQQITSEQQQKQELLQDFGTKDLSWWKNEIRQLQHAGNPSLYAMNQRLLGFISLACYSYASQFLHQQQYEATAQILGIYKMADPENADQPFFQACYYAQRGDTTQSLKSLQRAVALGFSDSAKLVTEPLLSPVRNSPSFQKIVESIH